MSPVPPLLAVDAASAAVLLALAVIGARRRGRPGALAAGLLWLVLAAVAVALVLGRAGALSPPDAVYALIFGWIVAVPLWAAFVFTHTGLGPPVTRQWAVLAGVYVVVVAATTLHAGGIAGPAGYVVQVSASVFQTVLIGGGLFGVFLLVRSAVSHGDLPLGQAASLSAGGTVVSLLVFSAITLDVTDPEAIPPGVTGVVGITAVAFAVAVVRYRPFDETPGTGALARASVFEEMGEAVVVVDREGHVVDANGAAQRTLGVATSRDAGRAAEAVLGVDLDAVTGETALSTPDGRRTFDVTRSVLTNRQGETVGRSYLFRDVTDQRTRRQRLEVLDRVLRHNLNNDLDAIRGFAEALSDGDADEPAALARRIHATATDLVDLGETVERADQLTTRGSLDTRKVDLGALLGEVAATVDGRYDCRISIGGGDAATLHTDRAVLRTALLEVIENAVEHSDAPRPAVTVDCSPTASGVRITVSDDGPGIPARERAVLLEGEETPLQHGTGVGLWFVSWAVTRLGGKLSFDDTGESGSAVVLDIPDRDSADDPGGGAAP